MRVRDVMSSDPVTVSHEASVDRAMELMDEHDVRHLPVLANGTLVSILSDRDLFEATGWLHPTERRAIESREERVRDLNLREPVGVEPDSSLNAALGLMVQGRIGSVAVVQQGGLVGLMTEMDVLRAYTGACRTGRIAPDMDPSVEDHMSRDPISVTSDTAGDVAAEVAREAGLRHLLVVDDSRLVGILSDRDVRRQKGRGQLETTLVREMMSPDPQAASPLQGLSSAALVLQAERISAMPVLSGRDLVGIITLTDVLVPCAAVLQGVH